MKILISSNSHHTTTGYGMQTRGAATAFTLLGHEVAVFAWYGLSGGMLQAGPIKMYPKISDEFGADAYVAAGDFEADIVITLQDLFTLPPNFAETLPCPWAPWFPIDSEPLAPIVQERAISAAYPLVFSRFGERTATAAGVPVTYIPHAFDPDIYCPGDRVEARRLLHMPEDKFIVSMVAANISWPSRKAFPEAFTAFKRFHDVHPDTMLYVHSMRSSRGKGPDLKLLAEVVGIPADAIMWVNQADYLLGLPSAHVANVYRASNVLLSPSLGEGFGLPILEAQACGTPVITGDWSSMPELTINGLTVQPTQRFYNPIGSFFQMPDVESITVALHRLYTDPPSEESCLQAAHHLGMHYAWPVVQELYWRPFLESFEATLS